jgi:hypothetical protein
LHLHRFPLLGPGRTWHVSLSASPKSTTALPELIRTSFLLKGETTSIECPVGQILLQVRLHNRPIRARLVVARPIMTILAYYCQRYVWPW